jgi:hypothetical protein
MQMERERFGRWRDGGVSLREDDMVAVYSDDCTLCAWSIAGDSKDRIVVYLSILCVWGT